MQIIRLELNIYLSSLLLDLLESKVVYTGNAIWQCVEYECESNRTVVRNHVEAKHLPSEKGYVCQYCQKHLKNKIALNDHLICHV